MDVMALCGYGRNYDRINTVSTTTPQRQYGGSKDMKSYRLGMLICAIILSVFAFFPFSSGDRLLTLIVVGILFLWWSAYEGLCRSIKGSFTFSWSLNILAWCGLLAVLILRMQFVLQSGGSMEGPHGEGSPMAFLIGLTFEVFLFLVFSTMLLLGLRAFLEIRKGKREANQE
jgi:hypothetical protein